MCIGCLLDVGTGTPQERVIIQNIDSTTGSLTGIFTNNHANPTQIYGFTAANGIDFSTGFFAGTAATWGNLQGDVALGLPGVYQDILDTTGTLRPVMFWDTVNMTHFGDVGTGFRWDATNGADWMDFEGGILRIAGSTAPGPPSTAGRSQGDEVLFNNNCLASDTAVHNATFCMIQGSPTNKVLLDSQGQGTIASGNMQIGVPGATGVFAMASPGGSGYANIEASNCSAAGVDQCGTWDLPNHGQGSGILCYEGDPLCAPPQTIGFGGTFLGVPTSSQIIYQFIFPSNLSSTSFAAGLAGSVCVASAGATGSTDISLQKNGTAFGTATFAAIGGPNQTCTFAAASTTSFTTGDILTFVNPSPADGTLANITITIEGTH